MARFDLSYFIENARNCFECSERGVEKKCKASLINKTLISISNDVELKELCERCDGTQKLVHEKIVERTAPWIDSVWAGFVLKEIGA